MRVLLILALLLLVLTACGWNDRILPNRGEEEANAAVAELYPNAILVEELPLRCEGCRQYVFRAGEDVAVKATVQGTEVVEVIIIEGATLDMLPEECEGIITDGCIPGEVEMGLVSGAVSGVCCAQR